MTTGRETREQAWYSPACMTTFSIPARPRLRTPELLRTPFIARLTLWSSIALLVTVTIVLPPVARADALAYWSVWPDPYGGRVGDVGAYLYSPAFAQLIWPLTLLPFAAFFLVWKVLHAVALVYLVGWRWAGFLAALAWPVIDDFSTGNIHLFLAVAIALGGPAWSFVILTKVTPGIGVLWYAVRREWRSLGLAIGATAAAGLVSFALAPELWREWFGILTASTEVEVPGIVLLEVPLAIRLPIAAAIVVLGALRGWRWTIAVSALVAMPALWFASLCLLLAIPRLGRRPQVAGLKPA